MQFAVGRTQVVAEINEMSENFLKDLGEDLACSLKQNKQLKRK